MMSTPRKPKALLDAEKKITELEKKLADAERSKDTWYKQYNDVNTALEGIHDVLDDLGVRRYRGEQQYSQYQLPIAVRLFAWAMKMAGKAEGPQS